ncbi:hypothetical protein DFH29DRAFT_876281 [Suillus ampliporus]|nr:hypothetical protein DFH29DRAFT_876281 [Suillus ampliporus]
MAGIKHKFKTWTENLPWKKRRINANMGRIASSDKENTTQVCAEACRKDVDASNDCSDTSAGAKGMKFDPCTPRRARHALNHWFGNVEDEWGTHSVSPFFGLSTSSPQIHKTLQRRTITCEDVMGDENDMIAIGGLCWRDTGGLQPMRRILEPVPAEAILLSALMTPSASLDVDGGDNEMDNETDDECGGNNESGGSHFRTGTSYASRLPPSVNEAREALKDLRLLLKPPRHANRGYNPSPFEGTVKKRLELMELFLDRYTNINDSGKPKNSAAGNWTRAAEDMALFFMKGSWLGRNLRSWARAYINDRANFPTHKFGLNVSCIEDEALAADIKTHLQSLGKYIRTEDIVNYLKDPEVQKRHGFSKSISPAMAKRWMKKLGFCWKTEGKGMYSDGHEWGDIVEYRQNIFLPAWASFQSHMQVWKHGDVLVEDVTSQSPGRRVVVWFHDESTFYANDRRKLIWEHKLKGAVPQPKGEGSSLMVADFMSADYGAGKTRDGYYTNNEILRHMKSAMSILEKDYADEDHIFIFDNATTHLKHPDDALSARNMPKNPSQNWGVTVTATDMSGKPLHGSDGKPVKKKVPMAPGHLRDGTVQPLYFPTGHPKAGWFKGMATILHKRGFEEEAQLRLECPSFKCPSDKVGRCCCRRVLYQQPDFSGEQCWGCAKHEYHKCPPSQKDADLERNVIKALDSVTLESMHKSQRFMDAYRKGLNGQQAAWAAKLYHGHRVLPEAIMHELDNETIV